MPISLQAHSSYRKLRRRKDFNRTKVIHLTRTISKRSKSSLSKKQTRASPKLSLQHSVHGINMYLSITEIKFDGWYLSFNLHIQRTSIRKPKQINIAGQASWAGSVPFFIFMSVKISSFLCFYVPSLVFLVPAYEEN